MYKQIGKSVHSRIISRWLGGSQTLYADYRVDTIAPKIFIAIATCLEGVNFSTPNLHKVYASVSYLR